MAKTKQVAYKVTDLSPLYYNGKMVNVGEIATDIPGEDISWLLETGYIVPAGAVTSAPEETLEEEPVLEETADETTEEEVQ
jgi:hypothetical protein